MRWCVRQLRRHLGHVRRATEGRPRGALSPGRRIRLHEDLIGLLASNHRRISAALLLLVGLLAAWTVLLVSPMSPVQAHAAVLLLVLATAWTIRWLVRLQRRAMELELLTRFVIDLDGDALTRVLDILAATRS